MSEAPPPESAASDDGRTYDSRLTSYDCHIAIIGGGIAGLAAAYRLAREMPDARVTLLEGTDRLGGKIVTERGDGFIVEGGPDSFLAS